MPANMPNPKKKRVRRRKKAISRGNEPPIVLGIVRPPKIRLTPARRDLIRHVQRHPGTPLADLVPIHGATIIKGALALGLIRFESENDDMPVFCDAKGWQLLP